ncbi:MAG: diaminopimelate epimerase [Armatimonadota bacterium]|nr:diaminopimelate epimerase [Armatimonadota bacterium]MDR7448568.1 diaminopimelate epimerase [Armatimonadota bacterium]MDR7458934.1 diaminopimelate epimerase [Armatimonadota bacterium]MDR7478920.1 diaminopimelate epimerase [Armatimonadota bacterium]MDR7489535.1 diaminopimelate epimerase [Armatimonadota bacterium]
MTVSPGPRGGRIRLRGTLDWFIKGHGLGNDYLVVDPAALTFPLTPPAVRAICDRHTGVGSDGILALGPSTAADVGVRIFNPDGSEAEKSGNGLRILARVLYDHGFVRRRAFTVETAGGVARALLEGRAGAVEAIAVDVGRVTFDSTAVPVTGPPREVVDEPLPVEGEPEPVRVTALSVGNPHCVVFVPALDPAVLHRLGPRLETHPAFPRRTNVQLVQVVARDRLAILIWERGVGPTQASGTSACAAAAAAVRGGLTDRHVTVAMPGGDLQVTVAEDWALQLRGPAEEVCVGRFTGGLLARLRGEATREGAAVGGGVRRGEAVS